MYYVVNMIDTERKNIFHLGYSRDIHIAESYLELRKGNEKNYKQSTFKFKIYPIAEAEFDELSKRDNQWAACSEITKLSNGIYVSKDDEIFLTDCLYDSLYSMKMHINPLIEMCKLVDDDDFRKLGKLLKKCKSKLKKDFNGEEMLNIDWEQTIKFIKL